MQFKVGKLLIHTGFILRGFPGWQQALQLANQTGEQLVALRDCLTLLQHFGNTGEDLSHDSLLDGFNLDILGHYTFN